MAKFDAAHALTGEEWMTRGRALTDGGFTNEAIAAFDHAGNAPGTTKISVLDRMRAKGDALFRAGTRYGEAAAKLNECAQVGGAHAAEDSLHAARGFVARRPGRPGHRRLWANRATLSALDVGRSGEFLAARLHILHGRWREAATGFDDYVRHFPSGAERHDAARNRAIAHLMAGDHREARKLFEELASDDRIPSAPRARSRWRRSPRRATAIARTRSHAGPKWRARIH